MNGLRPAISGWLWRGGLQLLILAAGLGVLFGGLMTLARMTREKARASERYTALFADIECAPPPEGSRAAFLNEVRYLTDFPERLHLLDDDLKQRLYEAFSQHPWVEKVERVEVEPPRQIIVALRYRTPVLAVAADDQADKRILAVVDRRAIVLPASASSKGLPTFFGTSKGRTRRAGALWEDDGVIEAARTAWFLRPQQERLHVTGYRAVGKGLVITTQSGASILWGRPPGLEEPGEAPASKKLERLLRYCSSEGNAEKEPGAPGYDVRPLKDRSP
jgi:hypothetical protein